MESCDGFAVAFELFVRFFLPNMSQKCFAVMVFCCRHWAPGSLIVESVDCCDCSVVELDRGFGRPFFAIFGILLQNFSSAQSSEPPITSFQAALLAGVLEINAPGSPLQPAQNDAFWTNL